MQIQLDGAGNVRMAAPQQLWSDGDELQTAYFAGESLMAVIDESGFCLNYLGYKVAGFGSMEEAKQAAPEFARKVLVHKAGLITEKADDIVGAQLESAVKRELQQLGIDRGQLDGFLTRSMNTARKRGYP